MKTFGVIDTSTAPSQQTGTVSHPSITPESTVILSMERNSAEDIDISAMQPWVVGPIRAGEFDWELKPFVGHDNPVKIHFVVYTV